MIQKFLSQTNIEERTNAFSMRTYAHVAYTRTRSQNEISFLFMNKTLAGVQPVRALENDTFGIETSDFVTLVGSNTCFNLIYII